MCSTYFEILIHIEEILINDRDVSKFVIFVRMVILITFPEGQKPSYVTVSTSFTNPIWSTLVFQISNVWTRTKKWDIIV
jgi:hypothetical protein